MSLTTQAHKLAERVQTICVTKSNNKARGQIHNFPKSFPTPSSADLKTAKGNDNGAARTNSELDKEKLELA